MPKQETRGEIIERSLRDAPLGTKAPAIMGGHWVRVERGWKWHCGDTFPSPGGDWDLRLIYPDGHTVNL